jgi:NADPH-dependent 7-cyano-7-deazaguanine reductase QueF
MGLSGGLSELRTFDVEGVAEVRIRAPVRSICPFDLTVDESVLTISYAPAGRCVEMGSLANYLDGYGGREISHEQLVVAVRADLVAALEPTWITVEDAFPLRAMTLWARAGERS